MATILNSAIVLSLNANWQILGFRTVKQAITSMAGGDTDHPTMALDITLNEEGGLLYAAPVKWEDWLKLPVREGDLALTTKTGAIRCPTCMVCSNYNQMPLKTKRLTRQAILERDGYTCAYSGKVLPKSQLNVDHVIPRDRGGRDSWENMVASDKNINSRKGNKLNSEAGLVLRFKPKAPIAVPASCHVKEPKHRDHVPFIPR